MLGSGRHHPDSRAGAVSVRKRSGTAFADGAEGPAADQPKLKIEGILLTMTDSRTNYGQQIDNLIRGAYGSKIKVFDQTIPRSVRAAEISAVGKSIFQHDPKGKVQKPTNL